MFKLSQLVLLVVVVGLLSGGVGAYLVNKNFIPKRALTAEDRIKEFYLTEAAVHTSPHGLRKHMSKGDNDFILVDLRSREEYNKEHIVSAINIPAYSDPNNSAYGEIERIIGEFEKLGTDKEIIVYCYSTACMTGRKVGKMLAENGIFVKHLGIGWNEWRYYWGLWNHDGETSSQVDDYIVSGPKPGEPKKGSAAPVCDGELGC